MNPTEDLVPILKKLRLSGVLSSMELRTRQAVEDNLAYDEYLLRLLGDEVERREAKQLEQRLRRASFEHRKTFEDFDFSFNGNLPKSKIIDLASCNFIARHEHVLLVGPAGVGKSHIAQAIGQRACMAGYTAVFVSAQKLFADLRAARADGSYERKLLRYTNPDVLVVDDLGLRPLRNDEPEDLHEVIRNRYERGSMIATSNRSVEEWYPLFGDPLLASAAMDRLLHHAHIIEIEGDSYRTSKRKPTRKETNSADEKKQPENDK
jgi:DNA replication protein DnaC